MVTSLRLRDAIAALALLGLGAAAACDTADSEASEGKAILYKSCARCHSIEAKGDSPLPQAPPLREIYLKYPIDQLEEGFAEGMGSKHRDMPQIQFSSDQVAAILDYLGSITGVDPAERQRAVIPGETPP
jgi:mono/diheme cytochrome c family protein